jgi:hypothetical protein
MTMLSSSASGKQNGHVHDNDAPYGEEEHVEASYASGGQDVDTESTRR